jgi:hypothetical protein
MGLHKIEEYRVKKNSYVHYLYIKSPSKVNTMRKKTKAGTKI